MKYSWLKTLAAVALLAGSSAAQASDELSPTSAGPKAQLQVCCRSLTKWSASGNWVLRGLNLMIISHIHHCYADFPAGVLVPGLGVPVQTMGIHPLEPKNNNKQPILDQGADNSDRGGYCKQVKDATPEKITRLAGEIAGGTCYSCGPDYHNRALTGCFNNSNTYVYDLVRGAGMTPPPMRGAPGYRHHHDCGHASSKAPQP